MTTKEKQAVIDALEDILGMFDEGRSTKKIYDEIYERCAGLRNDLEKAGAKPERTAKDIEEYRQFFKDFRTDLTGDERLANILLDQAAGNTVEMDAFMKSMVASYMDEVRKIVYRLPHAAEDTGSPKLKAFADDADWLEKYENKVIAYALWVKLQQIERLEEQMDAFYDER